MSTVFTAFRFSVLMMLFCGLAYPLALTGVGQAFFPKQANGSLIEHNGKTVGSSLIGQAFTKAQYFHPRPAANSYDASNSGGANLAVSSEKLLTRIQADINTYQAETGEQRNVPIDAITASASSLDPHISLNNALTQVPRVAKARGLSPVALTEQIKQMAEHPLLSEAPYVNVLTLNIALDEQPH
jgi:potassium-transporting ATPase KdpC subunit